MVEINPLVMEFKIPAEGPIYAREIQYWYALHFIVLSHNQNGYYEDFLMYDCNPGGFLVVLVIRCVNATEATMKTACLV